MPWSRTLGVLVCAFAAIVVAPTCGTAQGTTDKMEQNVKRIRGRE